MIEKSIENDVHINELYILSHRHDNEINNSNTNYTVFNLSKLEDAPEVKSVASFLALGASELSFKHG
jgi:hypothetical protein